MSLKSQSDHSGIETRWAIKVWVVLDKSQSDHSGIETTPLVRVIYILVTSQSDHSGIETHAKEGQGACVLLVAIGP